MGRRAAPLLARRVVVNGLVRWEVRVPEALRIAERVTRRFFAKDGQTVGAKEFFNVGGEMTAYPCGPGLSAPQAVNCRCCSVSVR